MNTTPSRTFYGLGIAPGLLKRLESLKFVEPTPIQYKAIPIGLQGEDLVGIAQTGTGKTLAFCLPLIQRLSATKQQGLILCPTRELALQVNEVLKTLSGSSELKTAVIIGGTNIRPQTKALRAHPKVIVATPGRLIDHLQQRTVSLTEVGILILDEADRMLDMGFEPQIKKILAMLPQAHQTMLFSATMPAEIAQIANKYMVKPLRVEVAPSGTTAEQLEQELFIVPHQQKMALLKQLLAKYQGTILVFSRTKYGAKRIAHAINELGHKAAEIHSNRSLHQRRQALDGFKSGRYRVLVATDIAARGIDVSEIELVINYDLPENTGDYIHRVGRTGRAGNAGKAISFACPDERHDVAAIERLIKIRLPVIALPEAVAQAIKNGPPQLEKQPRSRAAGGRGRRSDSRRRADSKPPSRPAKQKPNSGYGYGYSSDSGSGSSSRSGKSMRRRRHRRS